MSNIKTASSQPEQQNCYTVTMYRLKTADCTRQAYTAVPQHLDSDIKVLQLSYNELSELDLADLSSYPSLQEFYVIRNDIRSISPFAFVSLLSLQILDLDWNRLTAIPTAALQRLPAMRILSLKGNPLRHINDDDLLNITNLEDLNLESCQLSYISRNAFQHSTKLTSLNIAHNQLYYLPPLTLPDSLNVLRVYGNPWTCDCRLRWLRILLQERSSINWDFPDRTPICDMPVLLRDIKWKYLTGDQFVCASKVKAANRTSIQIKLGQPEYMECHIYGSPVPLVTWYQGNDVLVTKSDRVTVQQQTVANGGGNEPTFISSTVIINQTIASDVGDYKCRAENTFGSSEVTFNLWTVDRVTEAELLQNAMRSLVNQQMVIGMGVATGLVVVLICFTIACVCYRKIKRHRNYMFGEPVFGNGTATDHQTNFTSDVLSSNRTCNTTSTLTSSIPREQVNGRKSVMRDGDSEHYVYRRGSSRKRVEWKDDHTNADDESKTELINRCEENTKDSKSEIKDTAGGSENELQTGESAENSTDISDGSRIRVGAEERRSQYRRKKAQQLQQKPIMSSESDNLAANGSSSTSVTMRQFDDRLAVDDNPNLTQDQSSFHDRRNSLLDKVSEQSQERDILMIVAPLRLPIKEQPSNSQTDLEDNDGKTREDNDHGLTSSYKPYSIIDSLRVENLSNSDTSGVSSASPDRVDDRLAYSNSGRNKLSHDKLYGTIAPVSDRQDKRWDGEDDVKLSGLDTHCTSGSSQQVINIFGRSNTLPTRPRVRRRLPQPDVPVHQSGERANSFDFDNHSRFSYSMNSDDSNVSRQYSDLIAPYPHCQILLNSRDKSKELLNKPIAKSNSTTQWNNYRCNIPTVHSSTDIRDYRRRLPPITGLSFDEQRHDRKIHITDNARDYDVNYYTVNDERTRDLVNYSLNTSTRPRGVLKSSLANNNKVRDHINPSSACGDRTSVGSHDSYYKALENGCAISNMRNFYNTLQPPRARYVQFGLPDDHSSTASRDSVHSIQLAGNGWYHEQSRQPTNKRSMNSLPIEKQNNSRITSNFVHGNNLKIDQHHNNYPHPDSYSSHVGSRVRRSDAGAVSLEEIMRSPFQCSTNQDKMNIKFDDIGTEV